MSSLPEFLFCSSDCRSGSIWSGGLKSRGHVPGVLGAQGCGFFLAWKPQGLRHRTADHSRASSSASTGSAGPGRYMTSKPQARRAVATVAIGPLDMGSGAVGPGPLVNLGLQKDEQSALGQGKMALLWQWQVVSGSWASLVHPVRYSMQGALRPTVHTVLPASPAARPRPGGSRLGCRLCPSGRVIAASTEGTPPAFPPLPPVSLWQVAQGMCRACVSQAV